MPMAVRDLTFPVLCFYKSTLFAASSSDTLTRTTSAALRGGLFNGLRVVDSTGTEYVVETVRKLHGIGPFWGFNIFLNRTVRIDITLVETGKQLGVDEVRRLVIRDFRKWHGWESRDDYEQLKASVQTAGSVSEIMHHLVP